MLQPLALVLFLTGISIALANATPDCWVTSVNTSSCTTDAGVTGNLAFLAFYNGILDATAASVVHQVQPQLGTAWQETVPVYKYHLSVSYLFCINSGYTDAIHVALRSFRWHSFVVTFARVQCEPGYIELALDGASEQATVNFTVQLFDHLIAHNIPINKTLELLAQPPHHVTVGLYDNTAAIERQLSWSLPTLEHTVTVQLDTLYFGTEPYFSSDFVDVRGLSGTIILVIVLSSAVVFLVSVSVIVVVFKCRCTHRSATLV